MSCGAEMKAIGERQEGRVLDSLAAKPQTGAELGNSLGIKRSNLYIYLARLRAAPRRVFICGHESRHRGSPAPIFAVGDNPDVEYVPLCRPTPKPSAADRQQQVLRLLREKPRTSRDLAACMHLVPASVVRRLADLREPDNRQVFISGWQHPSKVTAKGVGGDWAPIYAVGTGPDKPRPPRETSGQRHARLAKDPAYVEQRRLESQVRYTIQKHTKKKQGIFAALGL